MLHTTFNLLKQHNACTDSYRKLGKHLGGINKYGRDKAIPLSVGFEGDFDFHDELLWTLRAVLEEQERDRVARLFASDCAARVLPFFEKERPGDLRPRTAIKIVRLFALGRATKQEMAAARDAACDAAWAARDAARDAAWDAARAAWDAARAARDAARDAAWDAARATAWDAAWDAARAAAWDAAWDAETKWQKARFREYLENPDTKPIPLPRKPR